MIVKIIIPIYLPHPRLEILPIISLKSNAFLILSYAIILFNAIIRRKYAIMNNIIQIKTMTGNTDVLPTNTIPQTNTMIGIILYARITRKYLIPLMKIPNTSLNPGRSDFLSIENFTISY